MGLPLRRNVRFYVLLTTVFLIVLVFWRTWVSTQDTTLLVIRLTRYFALLALTYLYLALLIGPAVYKFTWLPWRGHIYRARRAVGFSAFLFAQIHAEFAFWGELGGIKGLPLLPIKYLIAITLSSTALGILTLMAATSFDKAVQYLGMKLWKFLHRFIYLASFLVVIHAFLIGTDFADLHGAIPRIFFVAMILLLWLEADRFDAYLMQKMAWSKKIPITLALFVGVVMIGLIYVRFNS